MKTIQALSPAGFVQQKQAQLWNGVRRYAVELGGGGEFLTSEYLLTVNTFSCVSWGRGNWKSLFIPEG